jgi:hypothetical protein
VLGYKLPRITVEGYETSFATPVETRPTTRVNRTGSRMGARRAADLSPEELQQLLRVG